MAEKLRKGIVVRLTQLMKENPGFTAFQKELNQPVYPMLAMRDAFEKNEVPLKLACEAVIDIWNQIPQDTRALRCRRRWGYE